MDDFYLIAKITSLAGDNGWVKIFSYSDFPERFFNLKKVYIDFFGEKKEFTVEDAERKKGSIFLKFLRFDTADVSEILVGKEIYVDSGNIVELPENTYFIHDLIGSEVFRNGMLFGVIEDVLSLPANDVYKIRKTNGKEILLPALKELIEDFDPGKKELILKPGENFYDDEN